MFKNDNMEYVFFLPLRNRAKCRKKKSAVFGPHLHYPRVTMDVKLFNQLDLALVIDHH